MASAHAQGWVALTAERMTRHAAGLARGQCQHQRRNHRRRRRAHRRRTRSGTRPAVVVDRTGRQRRPARAAAGADRAEPGAHDRGLAGVGRQGAAGRHAHAAQLRAATTRGVSNATYAELAETAQDRASCRSCWRRSPPTAPTSRPTTCIRSPSAQPKLRDHVWKELRPLLSPASTSPPPARAATGSGG